MASNARPVVAMPKRFLTYVFMGRTWVATFRTTRTLFSASKLCTFRPFCPYKGVKKSVLGGGKCEVSGGHATKVFKLRVYGLGVGGHLQND